MKFSSENAYWPPEQKGWTSTEEYKFFRIFAYRYVKKDVIITGTWFC